MCILVGVVDDSDQIREVRVTGYTVVQEMYFKVIRYKVCGLSSSGETISVPYIYTGRNPEDYCTRRAERYAYKTCDSLNGRITSKAMELVA